MRILTMFLIVAAIAFSFVVTSSTLSARSMDRPVQVAIDGIDWDDWLEGIKMTWGQWVDHLGMTADEWILIDGIDWDDWLEWATRPPAPPVLPPPPPPGGGTLG